MAALALPAAALAVLALPAAAGARPTAGVAARPDRAATAPVPPVRLPADEAPHHAPVEWWYFNGHLSGRDASGRLRSFGYELVTFQFLGLATKPLYFSDLAVTDLGRRTFRYAERRASHPVPVEHDRFALRTGTWTMSGNGASDELSAALGGYALHLRLRSAGPVALNGRDGVVRLGPFGTASYYSWTDLRTTGHLVDHGVRLSVTGRSWMDHEWGAMDLFSGAGWDWFSVQLSDGQQYMCYFLRDRAGKIVQALGTRIGPAGATSLAGASLAERATGTWTSPATGITYGSGWVLDVPGGHLDVRPDLLDQELDLVHGQGNVYWEGDSTISGVIGGRLVHGVGYTELNPPGRL